MTDHKPLYISQKNFLRIVRKLIKEKGADFIYKPPTDRYNRNKCVYQDPKGTPSCIVGHLIRELDPTFDFSRVNTMPVTSLSYSNFIDAHPNTLQALNTLQRHQDRGRPWGEAFSIAKQYLKHS